uniref:DA-P36 family member n=1 Tax=Rhipicephalus zambeziensis TaxID=60191 RepID=A0A224YDE6_9ACAR
MRWHCTRIMKLAITLGIMSLMVIFIEGTSKMLNLTEVAGNFLARRYGGRLKTYSLTQGYRLSNEPAVRGIVRKFMYEGACERRKGFNPRKCKHMHTWSVKKGIVTPFPLPANITVPYMNKTETFLFNLSGANTIPRDQRTSAESAIYTTEKKAVTCHFNVEVDFYGYVTFELFYARGDEPLKDAIAIGFMEDREKGLMKSYSEALRFNVTGTYTRRRMCNNRKNGKKF